MTYEPKTKSYITNTQTMLANDDIDFGELSVTWANFDCLSPLSFDFERKEDGVVVNKVSFNLPRHSAKILARYILENL